MFRCNVQSPVTKVPWCTNLCRRSDGRTKTRSSTGASCSRRAGRDLEIRCCNCPQAQGATLHAHRCIKCRAPKHSETPCCTRHQSKQVYMVALASATTSLPSISTTISLYNMVPVNMLILIRMPLETIGESAGAGAESVDNWLQSIEKYAKGELKIRSFHGFSMRAPAAFP